MSVSAVRSKTALCESLRETLRRYAEEADAGWSCGSFGAVAEFARTADEPVTVDKPAAVRVGDIAVVTARGGLRIDVDPDIRAVAYELPGRRADTWQQAIALCLPVDRCAMGLRGELTELGADQDALRAEDRAAVLFDLGLGPTQVDVCVRTADPIALACLRRAVGRSLLDADNPALGEIARLSPHRVFRCRFGRVEVYQPIPTPGGKTPEGPHTHVLPRLLAQQRTHAATVPIPEGWIPCMSVFPPSPLRSAPGCAGTFDPSLHEAFQTMWSRYAPPDLQAVKAAVLAALSHGAEPPPDGGMSLSRIERATVRVALRQRRRTHTANSPTLAAWAEIFDRAPDAGREG